MWTTFAAFVLGLALGVALTWWRWRMSLTLEERTRDWRLTAETTSKMVSHTHDYLTKLDETVGTLAVLVRTHLKMTTPEPLRGALARQVGEEMPEKPKAGWETPLPRFESEPEKKPKPSDMRER